MMASVSSISQIKIPISSKELQTRVAFFVFLKVAKKILGPKIGNPTACSSACNHGLPQCHLP